MSYLDDGASLMAARTTWEFDAARWRSTLTLRNLLMLTVSAFTGCGAGGKSVDPTPDPAARLQSLESDDVLPATADPEATNSGANVDHEHSTYDGLTLVEWRDRIKQIRFDTPSAADAVPGLIEIARDRDVPWYTRRQAALTLGRIGEPAQQAVPVLVELLEESVDDSGASTQLWSIKALALFGPVAREATAAFIELLESETQPHLARLSTLEALGRIGPAHPQTLPAVRIHPDPGRRHLPRRDCVCNSTSAPCGRFLM